MSARTVIERYLDALTRGDLDGVRASFAPTATWCIGGELPLARTYAGRDAIVEGLLVKVGALFRPDARVFAFGRPLTDGSTAVLEWRVRSAALDGTPYDNRYCGVFETNGEQITAVREYLDTLHLARVAYPEVLVA